MLTGLLRLGTTVVISLAITTQFSTNGTGWALKNSRNGASCAFKGMGEEDLRQHFLVQLNGQFECAATGKTFNVNCVQNCMLLAHQRLYELHSSCFSCCTLIEINKSGHRH